MINYNATDLLKFRNFVLENPDLKPAAAIRIFNIRKSDSDREFVKKLISYTKVVKRRYYSLDLGKHVRIELLLYQFAFNIQYSYDDQEQQGNLFTITIGIFSVCFMW